MAARVGSVSIFGPVSVNGEVIAFGGASLDVLRPEVERICGLLALAALMVPEPDTEVVEGLGINEVEQWVWLIEELLAVAEVLIIYCARLELLLWNELVDMGRRSGQRGCGIGIASIDEELTFSFFTKGGGSPLGGVDFRDDLLDALDGGRPVSRKGKRSFIRLDGLSTSFGRSSRMRVGG